MNFIRVFYYKNEVLAMWSSLTLLISKEKPKSKSNMKPRKPKCQCLKKISKIILYMKRSMKNSDIWTPYTQIFFPQFWITLLLCVLYTNKDWNHLNNCGWENSIIFITNIQHVSRSQIYLGITFAIVRRRMYLLFIEIIIEVKRKHNYWNGFKLLHCYRARWTHFFKL